MTDEKTTFDAFTPFSVRFAEPINQPAAQPLRYDAIRQVVQTLVGGQWIDRLSAPLPTESPTRVTKVDFETTDDQ